MMASPSHGTMGSSGGSDTLDPGSTLGKQTRTEYREQRKQYEAQKRHRKNQQRKDNLKEQLVEPSMQGWIKIRSRLKIWHKCWGVIYPGKLVLYEDESQNNWKATLVLSSLQIQERPTKKAGFSWKCTTEFGQDLFARKGPGPGDYFHNLNILPTEYAILRVASEELGRQWMAEIEAHQTSGGDAPLSRRQSIGSNPSKDDDGQLLPNMSMEDTDVSPLDFEIAGVVTETRWANMNSRAPTRINSFTSGSGDPIPASTVHQRTTISDAALTDFWNRMGSVTSGTESTMKHFPAGMIDSQSLLSKLADPFAMSSMLADAARAPEPNDRIIGITRWFLAGLCTRTAGVPILPALGEVYRCAFNPSSIADENETFGNRTFVLCEQVADNPPTSALVATNREAGWCLYGSVSGRGHLYGNSALFETDSVFRLILLNVEPEPEQYYITVPHARINGFVAGRTVVEFVGPSTIECADTGCKVKLNFNKGRNVEDVSANSVRGQLLVRDEVKGTISGQWSQSVELKMSDGSPTASLLENNAELKRHFAAKRTISHSSDLMASESDRVWQKALIHLAADDDDDAEAAMQKVYADVDPNYRVKFFENSNSDDGHDMWSYKYLDLRPWSTNDMYTIEHEGRITTLSKSDCSGYYASVREALPAVGRASLNSTRSSMMRSRMSSHATLLRSASRESSGGLLSENGGDDGEVMMNAADLPLDARVAALEARIKTVEAHNAKFQRVYIPLIGLLFALIQMLLPLFANLVFGVQL
eukprot:m.179035 g.179035  ORF g.179035 m.179035 type:complete len:761 (-) comp14667_c0_seq1:202-2484(-)